MGSFINHVDRAGGGVSVKTMFVRMREGGVTGMSTWSKMFFGFPFCAHEFKCPFGVTI